jgi:hypothetical protein
MTRLLFPLLGTVIGLSLLGPPAARADLITWGFNWSGSPTTVGGDPGATGGIFLLDPQPGHGSGSMHLGGTQLEVFSSAPAGTLDHFTNRPYTETLTLTDDASHQSGTLAFTGLFNGSLTPSQANITNTFTGKTTQTLLLGEHLYTVHLDQYIPPTPSTAGSLGADITVRATDPGGAGGGSNGGGGGGGGSGGDHHAPEPSSLILAGMGLASCGVAYWKRTRRKEDSLSA